MPRRFEAADLVLARSGASTVAELAAAGKPAVLIPLPTAADDHQRKNAEVMAEAGAARVLLEPDLTAAQLEGTLSDLLAAPDELRRMAENARTLAHPDAAERIAAMAIALARGDFGSSPPRPGGETRSKTPRPAPKSRPLSVGQRRNYR